MKLTPEQIESNVAAYRKALETGSSEGLEIFNGATWQPKDRASGFEWRTQCPSAWYLYRIKPTPKLRPWRPEEVPVGARIRNKTDGPINGTIAYMRESYGSHYIGYVEWFDGRANQREWNLGGACECLEHSTDGRTWFPCGVLE